MTELLLNPHFTVFGIDIYYYAVIIVCGIIVATIVSCLGFKARNMSAELVLTTFCIAMPIALVGTRLYYCVFYGVPVEEWFSIESMRKGGLAVYGGVIGGVIGGAIAAYVMRFNLLKGLDCVMPGVLLAQAIGRWANFVNDEAHGAVVTEESLQWFPYAYQSWNSGQWYQATFFWESALSLIGAILLIVLVFKMKKKPNGLIGCGYFVWYGIERFIIEGFRTDSLMLGNTGIRVSQLLAFVLTLGGLLGAFLLLLHNKKTEGKWFGSKYGEPLVTAARSTEWRKLNRSFMELEKDMRAKQRTLLLRERWGEDVQADAATALEQYRERRAELYAEEKRMTDSSKGKKEKN